MAIPLGVKERAQTRHMPGDPSSGVQGQPLVLKLEVMGFALGNMTIVVEVVYPMHACMTVGEQVSSAACLRWKVVEESKTS